MTREEFMRHAETLSASVDCTPLTLNVKSFRTGSVGWYESRKIVVEVNGVPVACQLSLCLTAVGSKMDTIGQRSPRKPQEATQGLFDAEYAETPPVVKEAILGVSEATRLPDEQATPVKRRKRKGENA